MIIAVIICLIAIIFIMLDTIKKIKPEEQPKDKAEFSDIQIKTEENIYEQYKIKEDSKKYNEDGIMQIQLQFSKDLFDDEYISNEEYFEALIEDFVKIHKTDFELIDNKKKIKIQVKATSENNYDYTINSIEDYFKKAEEKNELVKNKKEIKEVEAKIKDSQIKRFDTNNWSVKASGVKILEYGKDYLGYENYKVLTNDLYIDSIIFENTYEKDIVDGIKLGDSQEEIKDKLGDPTFSEDGIFGYKTTDSYIFFYDNEVVMYPNENFSNLKIESAILNYINSEEKEARNIFAYKIMNKYMDFKTDIDKNNNLNIYSINRGINISIDENLHVKTTLFNNYDFSGKTMKYIRDEIFETNFDKDLIYEAEKLRK